MTRTVYLVCMAMVVGFAFLEEGGIFRSILGSFASSLDQVSITLRKLDIPSDKYNHNHTFSPFLAQDPPLQELLRLWTSNGNSNNDNDKPIQEAIEFHLEGLQEDGESIPQPNSSIEYIEAKVSA